MKLLENDLLEGSSGKFGKKLVYRRRGDKTIIARRPYKRRDANTPRQQEIRETFAEGILYAKTVIADEAIKAVYQAKVKGYQTAFNLALSDFCKAPQITKHNVSEYSGQAGDKISIRVVDDFKVEWVKLVIKDCADSTIEEGLAILSANGADWIYTATAENATLPGTKLIMSAADMPGNVTTEEVVL
ncbi:hypothetical protein [Daejeonella sp.]|uniref:hypothetical protein n=1 Tax=Daejeonella sp. TaxID=2805397 RepID=UPI00398303CC